MAKSEEELKDNGRFGTLSAKLSEALTACFVGEFAKRMNVREEEYLQKHKKMMTGRQMGWHMDQHFRLGDAEGTILEFQDLQAVVLKGDNLAAFQNEWDSTLNGINSLPGDEILESMYRAQVEKSVQFHQHMAMYETEIMHNRATRN